MSRRTLLAAAASLSLGGCSSEPAASDGVVQVRYGDDESQIAELHLPPGTATVPVAVVIHGGFWQSAYGMSLATPLAADLARNGIAGYAIEYRRVGNGGGWPATFEDVAAAIDALADQPRVELGKVVAIGHSAGGHLAVWAAGRSALPPAAPGAAPRVQLRGAVSQAGVLDLAAAHREQVGGSAVQELLGGTPDSDPDRYALASPIERLPLKVPIALVHGTRDAAVPLSQSQSYLAAARKVGDPVTLKELAHVGHFELIDPRDEAWHTCRAEATRLLS
ncbi:alpha/beta fold hydrolase [Kribbella sandramycini]|uniref:Acetyl esterase/lipase n=1 Tax=Kribbella sandramycini TaxID=60450 RepID=A0A7Y4P112_9ACTN|nr:alpha/beta fold hydrolase [Kribbella sandramycini]MBB6565360.1 acetyl esterase/lipase [Kribbella sandramycini]NOL41629.1 alpha/beta fold hydrolase [Kribbella sandramycini]